MKQKKCKSCGKWLKPGKETKCYKCKSKENFDNKQNKKFGKIVSEINKDLTELANKLDKTREVSYPLAAAMWDCSLKDAIKWVNALVRADILRSGSITGRFRWRRPEEI